MYINYEELGQRIAKKRKSLGLKQTELAEQIGCGDKHISSIEKARGIPSIDIIMKICDVLGTTPNYLLLDNIERNDKTEENLIRKIKILSKSKYTIEKLSSLLDWAIDNDL